MITDILTFRDFIANMAVLLININNAPSTEISHRNLQYRSYKYHRLRNRIYKNENKWSFF